MVAGPAGRGAIKRGRCKGPSISDVRIEKGEGRSAQTQKIVLRSCVSAAVTRKEEGKKISKLANIIYGLSLMGSMPFWYGIILMPDGMH